MSIFGTLQIVLRCKHDGGQEGAIIVQRSYIAEDLEQCLLSVDQPAMLLCCDPRYCKY